MGPSAGAIPGPATAGKVCRSGRGSRWPHRSPPSISDSGNEKPQCFPRQSAAPSPGGVGRSALACWLECMGSGAWHFFTDSPCLFLGRLSPVPTPHLCKARDPAFSGTGEGKGPGRRDRWGAFPPQGCCAGTLNDSLSLPGRGGGGPCAGQQSAPGASERWRPLRHEHSALQSCGNLISLKGLLSAKTWALGQALGVQFGKTALNLILKEGPV